MPNGTSPAVLAHLRNAARRGATVLGMCAGAFALAEAGVLDGRVAATHWRYADSFTRTFPEVEVDRDVVVQAVLNLLANAAKYGDGAIEVEVGGNTNVVSISVRDHGPGIPASEQPRIFREFYRSPEAYRSGVEGTGLGLALVKRHIEALGGTVEVVSAVGEGATFTIRFARASAEVA